MHSTSLIYSALRKQNVTIPQLPNDPVTATCAVTGEKTVCLPRNDVLGKSFTNQNILRDPSSDYVGVDVFYAWNYGYNTPPALTASAKKKLRDIPGYILDALEAITKQKPQSEEAFLALLRDKLTSDDFDKYQEQIITACRKNREKRPERMASWFCDGKQFLELDKATIRERVLTPPTAAHWSGYVTTSYKKHGSLLTPVNSGERRFWVFETSLVDCSDVTKVNGWWTVLREAQNHGFSRTAIETVTCPPYLAKKYGLREWIEFQEWSEPKKLSALYQFLCYLLLSKDDLKKNESNSL